MGLRDAITGLFKSEEVKWADARVEAYADRVDRTKGRTTTKGHIARQVKAARARQ